MGDAGPPRPSQDDIRLDSWKEIAAYLGRDVRTVQRWEKDEGLPVHRHPHKRLGTIYAVKPEIDARLDRPRNGVDTLTAAGPMYRPWMVASACLVLLVAVPVCGCMFSVPATSSRPRLRPFH